MDKEFPAPPETAPGKPRAYSYIRMSTKEQLAGTSLKRQLVATRTYADAHGLDLVEKYDDTGVSAFRGLNAEHGALGRFLETVNSGDVPAGSYFIIESMDRLTRQTAHLAVTILSQIINNGIIVVTLDDGMKYSRTSLETNQYQLFIAVGAMMRAHDESKRKSGLITHVWTEKRKELVEDGTPMTSRVPAWLTVDRKNGCVETIPERAALVKEVFNLACSGYGTYSIAKLLNTRGDKPWGSPKRTAVRSKTSSDSAIWRESYIKKILTNRAVLGEFQPHRLETSLDNKRLRVPVGDPLTGYYPRVISDAMFRDVALAIERRRTSGKGRKGTGYANVFSGLLSCGLCTSGMRYLDKGAPPKGGKYLRCSSAVSGGACKAKAYRYEAVETVILSALDSLDAQKILSGVSAPRQLDDKKDEREAARKRVEENTKKITRLNQLLVSDDGEVPLSTLTMLRELERQVSSDEQQIKHIDDEIDELLAVDPVRRRKVLDEIRGAIGDLTDAEGRAKARRALAGELQRMISAISVKPEKQFAYEVMDVDPSWQKKYRADTQSRLQSYLDDYGFEVNIRYRNGEQQMVSGVDGKRLKLRWSERDSDLKLLARHG